MFRLKGPKLRYASEYFSLYNKWIRYGSLVFIILMGLVGIALKQEDTNKILFILLSIYGMFGIWTLIVYIKKMKFIKNGRSVSGEIIEVVPECPRNDLRRNEGVTYIKLRVKYTNPYTNKEVETLTGWMTDAASRLKSYNVTVYVLEDGTDFVTYFDV